MLGLLVDIECKLTHFLVAKLLDKIGAECAIILPQVIIVLVHCLRGRGGSRAFGGRIPSIQTVVFGGTFFHKPSRLVSQGLTVLLLCLLGYLLHVAPTARVRT
jgi:hypothetical protein